MAVACQEGSENLLLQAGWSVIMKQKHFRGHSHNTATTEPFLAPSYLRGYDARFRVYFGALFLVILRPEQ